MSLALESATFAKRLDAAMKLEAARLRERLLAAVAEEKTAALEAAKGKREAESRRERELDELISSNAERAREARSKKQKKVEKKTNGEEEERGRGRTGEEGLLVVVDSE